MKINSNEPLKLYSLGTKHVRPHCTLCDCAVCVVLRLRTHTYLVGIGTKAAVSRVRVLAS